MSSAEDLQVVVAGHVAGRVRVVERPDELVVLAAELVSREDAAVLASLLRCRAIASGRAAVLLADVPAGDDGGLGLLVAAGAPELASQRLRLDLDGPLPVEDRVRLAPMGAEGYEAFRARWVESHVGERQLAAMLPDGPASPEQHLFVGWDGDRVVGHLWIGTERSAALVHHVEVAPEERRRGYGAALVRAGALWARERGCTHLGLDVSGRDTAMRALCASLGCTATDTTYRLPV